MNTGRLSRAAAAQTGSSSGSSSLRRDPSAFVVDRPNPSRSLRSPPRPPSRPPRAARRPSPPTPDRRSGGRYPRFLAPGLGAGRRPDRFQRALQPLTGRVVRGDHHADVQTVERRDEAAHGVGRREQIARVTMVVDHRVFRPLHRVLGHDQRRLRPVVDDARHRLNFRRHAATWPDLRHAGRTGLSGLDLHPLRARSTLPPRCGLERAGAARIDMATRPKTTDVRHEGSSRACMKVLPICRAARGGGTSGPYGSC